VSDSPRSVPDVAEQLMSEFETVCSPALVTEIVMRLARNGAVSLTMLAELARGELAALAGPAQPHSHGPQTVAECGCAP
jgi:hypothetical protein